LVRLPRTVSVLGGGRRGRTHARARSTALPGAGRRGVHTLVRGCRERPPPSGPPGVAGRGRGASPHRNGETVVGGAVRRLRRRSPRSGRLGPGGSAPTCRATHPGAQRGAVPGTPGPERGPELGTGLPRHRGLRGHRRDRPRPAGTPSGPGL